jgi:hypothetical protein
MKKKTEFDFSTVLTIAACDERLAALAAKKWQHYEHGVGAARREAIALRQHRKRLAAALQMPISFGRYETDFVQSKAFKILNEDQSTNGVADEGNLRCETLGRSRETVSNNLGQRDSAWRKFLHVVLAAYQRATLQSRQRDGVSKASGVDAELFDEGRAQRQSPVPRVSFQNLKRKVQKILTLKIC